MVAAAFTATNGLHGSPRLVTDLRDLGWEVSEKTLADSMRRQGLAARRIKRRSGLTRQDKTAPKFPDLLKRDFTVVAQNRKWVGSLARQRRNQGSRNHGSARQDGHRRCVTHAATFQAVASVAT
ncbi:IS3 family transposase [Mycolicibacterium xanthum]|uniref:IS3 family transposase n=1 Tax=Mycolicibacterium xanthum TaxID=2796469 RepID=UPI0035589E9D